MLSIWSPIFLRWKFDDILKNKVPFITEKCLATSSRACDVFLTASMYKILSFRQQDEKKKKRWFWYPFNKITTFATSELILEESFFGQFLLQVNPVISFCSHKTLANASFCISQCNWAVQEEEHVKLHPSELNF